MTREEKEKAIKYFKWWKSFNEHTQKAIPKDTIAYKAYQTEIGFYDMAIKALEQEPTIDYRRAFKIACELLSGSVLYGIDSDKIFEIMMQKDGLVSNDSYERYILNHLQELDHGQYEVVEE